MEEEAWIRQDGLHVDDGQGWATGTWGFPIRFPSTTVYVKIVQMNTLFLPALTPAPIDQTIRTPSLIFLPIIFSVLVVQW